MLSGDADQSSAVDEIAGNQDLLTQILLPLPPKTLIRFQVVSRHWLALISEPRFGAIHASRYRANPTPDALLFLEHALLPRDFTLVSLVHNPAHQNSLDSLVTNRLKKFPFGSFRPFRLRSSNGLLCVDVSSIEDSGRRDVFVYNPTTNQSRLILSTDEVSEIKEIAALNLVFDPRESDHYRVICVWLKKSETRFHFAIYSSRTQIWKECSEYLDFHPSARWDVFFWRGVYLNGSIHWVDRIGPFLRFDMDKECFKPMPSTEPPEGQRYRLIHYFGESGGCLHLIEIYERQATTFDVLELQSDYSGWYPRYRVDITVLTISYPSFFLTPPWLRNSFGIPGFYVDKLANRTVLAVSVEGKIMLFNVGDQTLEKLVDVQQRVYSWQEAWLHMETLASV